MPFECIRLFYYIQGHRPLSEHRKPVVVRAPSDSNTSISSPISESEFRLHLLLACIDCGQSAPVEQPLSLLPLVLFAGMPRALRLGGEPWRSAAKDVRQTTDLCSTQVERTHSEP